MEPPPPPVKAALAALRCLKCGSVLYVIGYGTAQCPACGQYHSGFGESLIEPPSQDYLDYCKRHSY